MIMTVLLLFVASASAGIYDPLAETWLAVRQEAVAHGFVCGTQARNTADSDAASETTLSLYDVSLLCEPMIAQDSRRGVVTYGAARARSAANTNQERNIAGITNTLSLIEKSISNDLRAARAQGDHREVLQLDRVREVFRPTGRLQLRYRTPREWPGSIRYSLSNAVGMIERAVAVSLTEAIIAHDLSRIRVPDAEYRMPPMDIVMQYDSMPSSIPPGARVERDRTSDDFPDTRMTMGLLNQPVRPQGRLSVIVSSVVIASGNCLSLPGNGYIEFL